MNTVFTEEAPAPAGHYAQARINGNLVFVSGQLPVEPGTGEKQLGSIEAQTRQVLSNLAAVLREAGTDLDRVIKTTVYVSDMDLWGRVNEVYAEFFGDHRPARAVVPTKDLHYGFQVEIEAVAALRNASPDTSGRSNGQVRIRDLSTPALLVERRRLETNLQRMQNKAEANGVALRPHIKTHKSVALARWQQQLGAAGLTVAKPSEAEVFVEAGFSDVRVAYPVVGDKKLRRLLRLMEQGARVSFCVDTVDGARAASRFFDAHDEKAEVLVKVDCGYGRVGVHWDEPESVDFVRFLQDLPGLKLKGILTHAGQAYHGPEDGETERDALRRVATRERDRMLTFARALRKADGVDIDVGESFEISIGSTPSIAAFENRTEGGLSITEIRPGTYVFNDATQVALGAASPEDCALTVLSTVVSTRLEGEQTHAIIDAGKKVFTADKRHGADGYGRLLDDPAEMVPVANAQIFALSEEHGWMNVPREWPIGVGDQVRVVPNHACVTVHTRDQMHVVDQETVVDVWPVDARGCVQ